jgi:AtzE family amidohydrolase
MIGPWSAAIETAALVRAGKLSALEVTLLAVARIEAVDRRLNAFTDVTAGRALAAARAVDAARARREELPPLAGVPFAVANLFDLAGVTTRAGASIERQKPPAARDAFAVGRLAAAGAVCMGALNMDEYGYGFAAENAHDGPCRNPHDIGHTAGGAAGGSAAAVAGGLVPLALGSDTNGSIRVPASLSGVFALKPTFGRLSRRGAFPLARSLDHVGPVARTVADLALAYELLQGADAEDPAQAGRPVEPVSAALAEGLDGLRIAVADGYFAKNGDAEALAAVARVASALHATRRITLPEAERARAAAQIIVAAEGAARHLASLQTRAHEFDPAVRDRFLAGAVLPAAWLLQAQRFRARYRARMEELFREVDVILAPATPCPAPRLGQKTVELDGRTVPLDSALGLYTQPLSLAGLPSLVVPLAAPGRLPIGVQLVAAPWAEVSLFRVAARLEQLGIARAPIPVDLWP